MKNKGIISAIGYLIAVVCWLMPTQCLADLVVIDGISYCLDDNAFSAKVMKSKNKYTGKMVIPSAVTYGGVEYIVSSIGNEAFYDCDGLTSIVIPNTVISIGEYAFYNCNGLSSVEIQDGVSFIGDCSFCECTSLTSIKIPQSVSTIDKNPFVSCIKLNSITVNPNNKIYDSRENCNAIIETSTNKLISGCMSTIIPSSVTTIGFEAFMGCSNMNSINIHDNITSIEEAAFDNCIGLTSIFIPRSVISIADYAFTGSYNLSSIEVDPYNLYYDSRDNCNAIIDISSSTLLLGCMNTIVPSGVTTIKAYSFYHCDGLTSMIFPNTVTTIEESAFWRCGNLANLVIPNSVTYIGEAAFADCYSLTSVEIPNSVNCINGGTFIDCHSLESIIIPSSVTEIFAGAFADCYALTSVTVESESPAKIDDFTFGNIDKTACSLYVPYGSKSAYESADYWNEFGNIVEYGVGPDTDISELENAIYIDQIEGRIGGTKDISIKLKNSYGVSGFQFSLEMPEGVTINNWSLSEERLPSGTTTSDMIGTGKISDNKISVACMLSNSGSIFTGSDGEIATVNVTFGKDMAEGDYPIYLTACDITDTNSKDEDLSDVKSTLILEDYLVGDANGDGKVRIGDATAILNYIVGNTIEGFNAKAADANGDGKIRIGDVSAVLNIIVGE